VDERWFRIGAIFEWITAAVAVLLLLWVGSVPIQRALGRGVQAAIAEADLGNDTPPGVPASATLVPVMMLLDGREVRQGDLHTRLDVVLPPKLAEGPPLVSTGQFGDRHTRSYRIDGTYVYVVCERVEPNGQMKVSGIYLP
jgi:hypothetical protein